MEHKTFKNIIVGVDLSPYSKVVVREAQELSSKMRIPMLAVYICSRSWATDSDENELMQSFELKIKKMYKLKDHIQIIIKFGRAADEVVAVAKEFESPLIMIGHKGFSALLRMFLGSTAESIAKISPFPVWIHRGTKLVLPKKILVPSDLTDRSDRAVLGAELFDHTFNTKFELFHVWQEPMPVLDYANWIIISEQIRKEEEEKIKNFKKQYPALKTGRTSGGITQTIQERSKKFDLIAISPSHENQAIFSVFGSVTSQLIRSSEKPVLVCP